MRVVFAGTPEFAAEHLKALINANFDIVGVYSQPDRPAGRGKKLVPSAVKALAQSFDLPVFQPENFKSNEAINQLEELNPDVMVVVAYGLLLPQKVLSIPAKGCINVHGSLLPKWRGAAPIQRSIWAGDDETGVTIMQMDAGLDTGPMLSKTKIDITVTDTSASLYQKLSNIGPIALVDTLTRLDEITPTKQNDELATYAKKLSKDEAKCNWQQSASQLARNVRAFNPWPVAWFEYQSRNIKIWHAQALPDMNAPVGEVLSFDKNGLLVGCGEGALNITKLQLPNKKAQEIMDVVNGNPNLFARGENIL